MNIGCLYPFYSSCPKQELKLGKAQREGIVSPAKMYETFFRLKRT